MVNLEEKQERLMQNLIDNERKRERLLKMKGLLADSNEDSSDEGKKSHKPYRQITSPHLTALSLRKITYR